MVSALERIELMQTVSNPRDLQLLLLLLTQVGQEDIAPVLTSLRVNSSVL